MISDPDKFIDLVRLCESLDEKQKENTFKGKRTYRRKNKKQFCFQYKKLPLGNALT